MVGDEEAHELVDRTDKNFPLVSMAPYYKYKKRKTPFFPPLFVPYVMMVHGVSGRSDDYDESSLIAHELRPDAAEEFAAVRYICISSSAGLYIGVLG